VRRILQLAAAAIAVAVAPAARAAPVIDVASFRVQRGDDPRWAAPDLDDASWPRAALREVTAPGGPIWLRATVVVEPGVFAADRPLGILFAGLASHEIYWDGARIGGGGVVGRSEASEVPGPVTARHWLPGELAAPGSHVIALRLSAFHRNVPVQQPLWLVRVAAYDKLGAAAPLYIWIAISSCSGLVLGAVFALVMFFYHRSERAFLHLCALCLTAVALLVAELWRPLFGYAYDWHGPRLLLVTSLTWLLDVLVVAFTVVRLPHPGQRRFVAIAAAVMACAWLVPGWDQKAWLMFLIGLGFAFGWTVRALRAGQLGSRPMAVVLAASLLLLVAAPDRFADVSVFLLIDFLLLCLIVPYAIERARERAHRDRALVTAARLENELVRRHLQPHFLMNTLTALSEWVDEDPRVAGELIGALAEELRLLHDILDRSLITMDEELRLCRAHLAIMSRRKGRTYRLVTTGVDARAAIPPAVFHTLVENAVTHGATLPASVELGLTGTPLGDRVRYVFEAPLGRAPPARHAEGAGTRYIRARLHESFGAQWTFAARAVDGVWRTEIEIPSRSA
jgi:hypothetical protein